MDLKKWNGLPYNAFSVDLRNRFPGQKVRKIPINAGFACPNKNGRTSKNGCIFCDEYGSGPIKTYALSIRDQIESFIKRWPEQKYIAYYQAHTNTYAPVSELEEKYRIILDYPEIVGLFIGTRPDAIATDIYPLLETFNSKTYLTVELGLQSTLDRSLSFLNRGHTYKQFLDTFHELKERGIEVVVHLIIGIPGESIDDMANTIREMNRIKPSGLKLHLFHILRGTALYWNHINKPYKLLTMDEYIATIIDLLELLDPAIVIHRLTGERDSEIFAEPPWALNKAMVYQTIQNQMKIKKSKQGKLFLPLSLKEIQSKS